MIFHQLSDERRPILVTNSIETLHFDIELDPGHGAVQVEIHLLRLQPLDGGGLIVVISDEVDGNFPQITGKSRI